jgi:tetratricopeptide (TPR) repeat protein
MIIAARSFRAAWPGAAPAALAALLAACAGPQRPAATDATTAVEVMPPGAVAPGAEVDGAAPGEAAANPALPVPADAQRRARDDFADGVRAEAAGDLRGAAGAFDRAFRTDPRLAYAGLNAGVVRERLGDLAGARAAYARVLDANPGFVPAAQSMVRLDIRGGRLAEGEKEIRARLERAPEAVGLLNALAELLLAAGRLDPAEEASRRALKADEKNVPAMVNLATIYQRKKRYELARMVLENARQIDDREAAVWNRLGFVELALGNRPQALESFRIAAALRPDYPEAHANYGAMLADAEDFAAAAAELQIAVRHAPGNALAWLDLGNAYRGAKDFERAEDAYRRALELDRKLIDVHYNLAVLYLDGEKPGLPALARVEQAVKHFDAYEEAGGKEPKLAEYRKDAARAIEREKKRLAREERDRLRQEAEARRKAEEARAEAERAAAGPSPAPASAPLPPPEGPAEPASGAPTPPAKGKTAARGAERSDR